MVKGLTSFKLLKGHSHGTKKQTKETVFLRTFLINCLKIISFFCKEVEHLLFQMLPWELFKKGTDTLYDTMSQHYDQDKNVLVNFNHKDLCFAMATAHIFFIFYEKQICTAEGLIHI